MKNRFLHIARLAPVIAGLGLVAGGCSSQGSYGSASTPSMSENQAMVGANSPTPPANSQGKSAADNPLTGSWEGTTLATCNLNTLPDRCNAEQNVKITLLQNDSGGKVTGYYACSYGNQNCFRMNETGKVVAASLNGRRIFIRVMTPDGTGYIFNGMINDKQITGGYSAMAGSSVIENGIWRATRAY